MWTSILYKYHWYLVNVNSIFAQLNQHLPWPWCHSLWSFCPSCATCKCKRQMMDYSSQWPSDTIRQDGFRSALASSTPTWRRNDMEMLSTILALCEGNPSFTSGFSSQMASDAELWIFPCCYPAQNVDQTVELWWFEMLLFSCDITAISRCQNKPMLTCDKHIFDPVDRMELNFVKITAIFTTGLFQY